MITRLSTTARAVTPVKWWSKAFPQKMVWEFKPGLNIIWGPNGSGKSTILTLLARLHFCEQLGRSRITEDSLRKLLFSQARNGLPRGITTRHDGQEVRYFSPERVVGRDCDSFDWDAGGAAALAAFMTQGSTGQLNQYRLIEMLRPERPKKIPWDDTPARCLRHRNDPKERDAWHDIAIWVDTYLKGNIDPGQPTVLLDEPDAGLDWPRKEALWDFLNKVADRVQWIVASHSIYAMTCPNAHYLELQPGYLASCRASVSKIIGKP